jgi:hypothetical protein
MFLNAISWINGLRKALSGEPFERSIVVLTDNVGLSTTYPNGDTTSIKWSEVERIGIQTTDKGPWEPDVWWILEGSTCRCYYPNGASGDQDALTAMEARFPGFDDKAVIRAMGSTSNAVFICWERGNAL